MDTQSELMRFAHDIFCGLCQELGKYGITVDPSVKLVQGEGMFCCYDKTTNYIYMSLPDLGTSLGKLKALFLRSLLGIESNKSLEQFIRLLLPHFIGHELGHYLRHSHGCFSEDLWYEEQIANHLASALTKYKIKPSDREMMIEFLNRAIETLSQKNSFDTLAMDSFHSPVHALNSAGVISSDTLETILAINRVISTKPEEMLLHSGQLIDEVVHRLERRKNVISEFNQDYASDFVKYLFLQLGWLLLDLNSTECQYIDEFKSVYLKKYQTALPKPKLPLIHKDHVLACYFASSYAKNIDSTISTYFYKRYRSCLIQLIEMSHQDNPIWISKKRDLLSLVENYSDDENESLDILAHFAKDELIQLFPKKIKLQTPKFTDITLHLPDPTDVKIFNHLKGRSPLTESENTRIFLERMFQNEIFRKLPVEIMFELMPTFWTIHLDKEEVLIYEGSKNRDIFFVLEGVLEVLVNKNQLVASLKPGQVFGEMAFFVNKSRTATVKASQKAMCLVIKSSDLRIFANKYPIILMQMARVLTERLEARTHN